MKYTHFFLILLSVSISIFLQLFYKYLLSNVPFTEHRLVNSLKTLADKTLRSNGSVLLGVNTYSCFNIEFYDFLKELKKLPKTSFTKEIIQVLNNVQSELDGGKNLFEVSSNFTELLSIVKTIRSDQHLCGNGYNTAHEFTENGNQVTFIGSFSKKETLLFPKSHSLANLNSPKISISSDNRIIISFPTSNKLRLILFQEKSLSNFDFRFNFGEYSSQPSLVFLSDPPRFREEIDILSAIIKRQLAKESKIHLQLTEEIFSRQLVPAYLGNVLPYVDSIGMEERGLRRLISFIRNGEARLETRRLTIGLSEALDKLRELWSLLNDSSLPLVNTDKRFLSRINLQIRGYNIIMVRRAKSLMKRTQWRAYKEAMAKGTTRFIPDSDIGRGWPSLLPALAKSSLITFSQDCVDSMESFRKSFKTSLDPKKWNNANMNLDIQFNSTDPVFCWMEEQPELAYDDEFKDRSQEKRSVTEHNHLCTSVKFCVSPTKDCNLSEEERVRLSAITLANQILY